MIEIVRFLRSLTVSCVLFFSLILPPHQLAFAKSTKYIYSAVVTRVVDGDTVWIRTGQGAKIIKVRIVGIDAPETCQLGGRASHQALYRRLMGQGVTLTATASGLHDNFGRLLAKIYLNGEDIGQWMVMNGYAWSYSYQRKPGPYAAAQSKAVAARRGLFNDSAAENPRLFRKRHGRCYA